MSTITKECIANLLEFNHEGSDCQANAEQWEVHELARIALASLEAEAVAWTTGRYSQNIGYKFGEKEPDEAPCIMSIYWDFDTFRAHTDCDATALRWLEEAIKNTGAKPLYTAPPASVSVPDAMKMDDDFDSAFEHGKAAGWNACRAAMLQGADGNSQVIPDGWVACSERLPENKPGSYEYLVFEGLNNRVQHDYWNVPDAGDDCQFTPFWNHYGRYVTHWMPLPAAPQQEVNNGN